VGKRSLTLNEKDPNGSYLLIPFPAFKNAKSTCQASDQARTSMSRRLCYITLCYQKDHSIKELCSLLRVSRRIKKKKSTRFTSIALKRRIMVVLTIKPL